MVEVDSYSLELEGENGFAGDSANKGAFIGILDRLRQPLRESGDDPLGHKPSAKISRKKLASLLAAGEPHEAAMVQSAVEEFAQQLRGVIGRFRKLKSWRNTGQIVVGGGFRNSRVGELAIARANVILKTEGIPCELKLLRENADDAGLIGSVHLFPTWMLDGHDAIVATDIGGTNLRAGIVELNLAKAKNLAAAKVVAFNSWCHRAEKGLKRDLAVRNLVKMMTGLIAQARGKGTHLAPVIGLGCPGIIREDGSIASGAHNLPGNWESRGFNLPHSLREQIPRIGNHDTIVLMHNDAVIQGLSEIPHMRAQRHWGILTIGTGLGNARFTTRELS